MKNLIFVLLGVLALILGSGCGKKEESKEQAGGTPAVEKKDDDLTRGSRTQRLWFDPVAGQYLIQEESVAAYTHNGIEYGFLTKENYEAFKNDPDKFLDSQN